VTERRLLHAAGGKLQKGVNRSRALNDETDSHYEEVYQFIDKLFSGVGGNRIRAAAGGISITSKGQEATRRGKNARR
jgi:hypothetical protein